MEIPICSFWYVLVAAVFVDYSISPGLVSTDKTHNWNVQVFGEYDESTPYDDKFKSEKNKMPMKGVQGLRSKPGQQDPDIEELSLSNRRSNKLHVSHTKMGEGILKKYSDLVKTKLDPDANRNLTQLITSQGYQVQTYVVQTSDGFLLDLHRIPRGRSKNKMFRTSSTKTAKPHDQDGVNHNAGKYNGKSQKPAPNGATSTSTRPVVFLQHGYMSSACDFVMNFANDSLAFILADAGYDVWLGNSRGNTYSRRHVSLTPDDSKFWDWSFDEMGQYDTPAFIDFILNKTAQPSLNYIGHSQGTMIAFALLSQQPEYQEKIRLFVGLAPIMSLKNMKSPMKYLAKLNESLIYDALGPNACFLSTNKTKHMADTVCAKPVTRWVCSAMLFMTNGPDISNLNKTRMPVYMNHTPAGTSVKNVVHYAQMVREKRFAKYDYGTSTENIKRYGQPIPPAYNVSTTRVPALLFTASKDWLADPQDVAILESTLPNIKDTYRYPTWNHMDFVLGMDAAEMCYGQILALLSKF